MIRRILVALDGSPRAPQVMDTAAEIARRFQAEVVPVRVIFVPAEFPPAAHVAGTDPLETHLRNEAEQALRALVARAPDVRAAPGIVRHGQPWRVLLDVADEERVDLIVIGSHGYHGWDRLLGTTAAKVVNLSRRSVLVVHEGASP